MLLPADVERVIRLSTVLNESWVCGREWLVPCSMLGVVLYCPALGWVVQCPLQHNYYSLCIFSIWSLWNMVSTRVLFIVWNRGCAVGTQGQQGVLGMQIPVGIVMGNCVGECVEARPDLDLSMMLLRAVPGVNGSPRPRWGIARLFKKGLIKSQLFFGSARVCVSQTGVGITLLIRLCVLKGKVLFRSENDFSG